MHRLQDLVRLHREGRGGREVARLLRMGPNTERQYREALQAAGLLAGEPGDDVPALETLKAAVLLHAPPKVAPQQQSTVGEWRTEVELLMAKGLRPRAIHDRLRLEHPGFGGSRSSIKRLVSTILRDRGVEPTDVAIPVDTQAGEIAQVDFGYAGHFLDPDTKKLRRGWVFVMVLGHSRHLFAQVVFDQKVETWLRMHLEAFRHFGGVPRTLVPDNLKAAVGRAAFGIDEDSALNRSYREMARHYGFVVDPTPPYAPKKKGKVEAAVRYVKHNGLAGRDGQDVQHVRAALARWTTEVAGVREHGTTGKRPLEVFESEERAALIALPVRPYETVLWKRCTVHPDVHVELDRRLYSVPWKLIGQEVWIRATPTTVTVYHRDDPVAHHARRGTSLRSTLDTHLPEHREALRHRTREYWQERARRLGADVEQYVSAVFDGDDVLSQLRKVQAIVTHLEKFPRERAAAACRRAGHFGAYGYSAVRDILRQGLDFEPTDVAAPAIASSTAPRFARDLRELVASRIVLDGGSHGPH